MTPKQASEQWGLSHSTKDSPDQGLINKTYVIGTPPEYILQWVNPIFSPLIHQDLMVIIQHAKQKGLRLPELIPLPDKRPCLLDTNGGCWRLWEFIPGKTIHKLTSKKTAAAAGRLVAEFHRGLSELNHDFIAPMRDVHNTPQRMADLEAAMVNAVGHPLEKEACELGDAILTSWQQWDGHLDLPKRTCHGDLKISNLRFSSTGQHGICLLDLDTVGPQTLSAEMGDAWRSWCNPASEDEPEKAYFNIEIFKASAEAYLAEAPPMTSEERESLAPGISRICLELSARFCADALENSYFKEDRIRFPEPGRHNLLKAKSQFKLARSATAQMKEIDSIINHSKSRIT